MQPGGRSDRARSQSARHAECSIMTHGQSRASIRYRRSGVRPEAGSGLAGRRWRALLPVRSTGPVEMGPKDDSRTRAAEVKPDGFGRYLHPGGACEFYLEYDRATEASGALTRKLEGYLKLAAGWTREQKLTGLPNLLILVPEEGREEKVASAFRSTVAGLHVTGSLASSFPLFVASEDRLTDGRTPAGRRAGPRHRLRPLRPERRRHRDTPDVEPRFRAHGIVHARRIQSRVRRYDPAR
jgi:hypothetical protein